MRFLVLKAIHCPAILCINIFPLLSPVAVCERRSNHSFRGEVALLEGDGPTWYLHQKHLIYFDYLRKVHIYGVYRHLLKQVFNVHVICYVCISIYRSCCLILLLTDMSLNCRLKGKDSLCLKLLKLRVCLCFNDLLCNRPLFMSL